MMHRAVQKMLGKTFSHYWRKKYRCEKNNNCLRNQLATDEECKVKVKLSRYITQ